MRTVLAEEEEELELALRGLSC
ncbi:hypothetical protein SBA3_40013 [Candidatus Sulfopaludibacter sp. SbA3]|nr:hypothetical protein SBA3_40013 [Candidatus Sulfopaludibacter sp. SbA3]